MQVGIYALPRLLVTWPALLSQEQRQCKCGGAQLGRPALQPRYIVFPACIEGSQRCLVPPGGGDSSAAAPTSTPLLQCSRQPGEPGRSPLLECPRAAAHAACCPMTRLVPGLWCLCRWGKRSGGGCDSGGGSSDGSGSGAASFRSQASATEPAAGWGSSLALQLIGLLCVAEGVSFPSTMYSALNVPTLARPLPGAATSGGGGAARRPSTSSPPMTRARASAPASPAGSGCAVCLLIRVALLAAMSPWSACFFPHAMLSQQAVQRSSSSSRRGRLAASCLQVKPVMHVMC